MCKYHFVNQKFPLKKGYTSLPSRDASALLQFRSLKLVVLPLTMKKSKDTSENDLHMNTIEDSRWSVVSSWRQKRQTSTQNKHQFSKKLQSKICTLSCSNTFPKRLLIKCLWKVSIWFLWPISRKSMKPVFYFKLIDKICTKIVQKKWKLWSFNTVKSNIFVLYFWPTWI